MTQNISSTAASAREASRPSTGQFGTQARPEAEIDLLPAPGPADAQLAHEEAEAQKFIAGFRSLETGSDHDDDRAVGVAITFQAADKANRARMLRAFTGLRWAADEVSYGPQIYGPARVDENDTDPPHWAAYRRGEGGYRAGSFTTNLMDLYDSETTTEEDRQAISQWWPHLAAAVDEGD